MNNPNIVKTTSLIATICFHVSLDKICSISY